MLFFIKREPLFSILMSSPSVVAGSPPLEIAAQFFSGLNEPRPTSLEFSLDGLFAISSHMDDAIRVVDVCSMSPSETIQCDLGGGVSASCFTQSSSIVCVAPRVAIDGHLYLLNIETASYVGAMAYVNDYEQEGELLPHPFFSCVAQCPVSDVLGGVIGSKGALALFHPLVSGAVAATKNHFIRGEKPSIGFSRDGNKILVGGDEEVMVLDRRMLTSGPVKCLSNKKIFRYGPGRCRGVQLSADSSRALLTSSNGEANVLHLHSEKLECTYFHHDAQRWFLGTSNNVPAKYMTPHVSCSRVVQMTSSMNDGRHLLVYEPNSKEGIEAGIGVVKQAEKKDSDKLLENDLVESIAQGALKYQLQSKDSDLPVDIAVNPRFQLIATAARHVTWWTF